MPFFPGDDVHVAAFGRGVVRQVRNGGRYLVELKGRSIVTREAQLTAVSARRRSSVPEGGTSPTSASSSPPTRSHVSTAIDLHGMTTDEAVAALAAFINDALLAEHGEVRVIHGRSGGRLKAAVHATLRQVPTVRAFRIDPANAGVTIVSL